MFAFAVVSILSAVGCGAYLERKVLKVKLASAEAKVSALETEAKAAETRIADKVNAVVRAFSTKIGTVISGAKADVEKAEHTAASIVAKIEADFKKL